MIKFETQDKVLEMRANIYFFSYYLSHLPIVVLHNILTDPRENLTCKHNKTKQIM